MVNWMLLWRFKEKPSGLSLFYKRLFYGALFLCERLHPPIQLLLRGFRGAGGTDVDFIPGESGGQSGILPLLADSQGQLVVGSSCPPPAR